MPGLFRSGVGLQIKYPEFRPGIFTMPGICTTLIGNGFCKIFRPVGVIGGTDPVSSDSIRSYPERCLLPPPEESKCPVSFGPASALQIKYPVR